MKPPPALRRLTLAAVAALSLLPASAAAVEPGIVSTGVVNNIDETAKAAELMRGLGTDRGWVRIFVDWAPMEPTAKGQYEEHLHRILGARIAGFREAGIKVLLVVTSAPQWSHPGVSTNNAPPDNPAHYADFMVNLANRFAGQVQAFEIWNEPDNPDFWVGAPQPARYAGLVKATYPRLKAALAAKGSNATITTGGLAGNNYDFVERMYAEGQVKGFLDAVGVHTDTACLVVPPSFTGREPDGRIGPTVFTGYREVRHVMERFGDADKQIWMTEIGWSTLGDRPCNVGTWKGRTPGGLDEETQAKYLVDSYRCMDSYIGVALWFSLQDRSEAPAYDHHLGLITHGGRDKLAFTAFRDSVATASGLGSDPGCGAKLDKDAPVVSATAPATYFDRLAIRASATDPTTTVTRMEIYADGKKVPGSQDGGRFSLDWLGAGDLGYGDHKIEVRAYDEARNVGTALLNVKRLNPATAPATLVARFPFSVRKKPGRRLLISGRIQKALGGVTEKPKGRVRIFIERKAGKRWKPISRYTKGIARPFKVNYKAKSRGTWRVRARFDAKKPYKNAVTKSFQFKL